MSIEFAFAIAWLVAFLVFAIVIARTFRSLWPYFRAAYRRLESWEKTALKGGLLLLAAMPVLEYRGANDFLPTAIGFQLLQVLGGALFAAGALMLLKQIHEHTGSNGDS